MNAPALSAERLRDLLHYDPETGIFTWRVGRRGGARAGAVAGSIDRDGYRHITIDFVNYLAHRLAWFWMIGEWPINEIDHRNSIRDDNRFAELREATDTQNKRNARISRANTSGLKGASFDKRRGRWRAQIHDAGKQRYLGTFNTAVEAHAAYCKAAMDIDPDFWRTA